MFDDFKYLADERTVISYDLRNRGRSDAVIEPSRLKRGVHHDVEDLETIRRHFNVDLIDVIGHSYVGMVVMLYAMKHADHVNRVVPIGPTPPDATKQYPAHLTGADATMAEVTAKMAALENERPGEDPKEFGRKMWNVIRMLFVADPADVDKINWSVADLPNESLVNVMKHFNENLLPSMLSLRLTEDDFASAKMPVLIVHGVRDRNAPYGGGREWALALPNARLLTIENAAHLPWIESADKVFGSVRTFLDGGWPADAEQVKSLTIESSVTKAPNDR